jgi:hypothetical protein
MWISAQARQGLEVVLGESGFEWAAILTEKPFCFRLRITFCLCYISQCSRVKRTRSNVLVDRDCSTTTNSTAGRLKSYVRGSSASG